jgi:hypothetical protein
MKGLRFELRYERAKPASAPAELAAIAAAQIHRIFRTVRFKGVEVAKCHHNIPAATISDVTSTAPTIHIP